MPEERKPEDPYEAIRVEIEKMRLEIERAMYLNENTRTFLERWRISVDPIREGAERSREMAFGFARAALQTMFFLNGGALIAFPAFAKLAGTGFKDHATIALLGVTAFVVGLALVASAMLCAFLAMDSDAQALFRTDQITRIDLRSQHNPNSDTPEARDSKIQAQKEGTTYRRRFVGFKFSAMIMAIASLAAFLVGCWYASQVLLPASNVASPAREFGYRVPLPDLL